VLEKDSQLIDQLIAAARMEAWVSRQAPLSLAKKFYLDFAATHGAAAVTVPLIDPSNGVAYIRPVRDVSLALNALSGMENEPLRVGLGAPAEERQAAISILSKPITTPSLPLRKLE
jgi:hypothetical protein